jgi:hypothetical protein
MKTATLRLLEGVGTLYLITLQNKYIKNRDTPPPPLLLSLILATSRFTITASAPKYCPPIGAGLACLLLFLSLPLLVHLFGGGGANERHQKREKKYCAGLRWPLFYLQTQQSSDSQRQRWKLLWRRGAARVDRMGGCCLFVWGCN